MIPDKSLRWNVLALAAAGPALLGLWVWVDWFLTPAQWCGVLVAGDKAADAGRVSNGCSDVLLLLLKIKDHEIWLLGGTLAVVIIAIGLAATGMAFKGKGFGGELEIGNDAKSAAKQVAGAAADKADEIQGEN